MRNIVTCSEETQDYNEAFQGDTRIEKNCLLLHLMLESNVKTTHYEGL